MFIKIFGHYQYVYFQILQELPELSQVSIPNVIPCETFKVVSEVVRQGLHFACFLFQNFTSYF